MLDGKTHKLLNQSAGAGVRPQSHGRGNDRTPDRRILSVLNYASTNAWQIMPMLVLLSSWRTRAALPKMDEVEVGLSRNADFRRLTFETGD